MSGNLYVVGLGFSGLEIARRAKAAGWTVAGSVTTADKAARLTAEGIDAEVLMPDSARLRAATHLVTTVAPNVSGDPVLPLVRHAPVKWLGYVSTTGVYGDRGGNWVDESDEPPARLAASGASTPSVHGRRSAARPVCRSACSACPRSTGRDVRRSTR